MRLKVPTGITPLEKLNEPLKISISADYANEKHIRLGKQSPCGGTRAREFVTDKDATFVRVHGEKNQDRGWMMRAEDIKGLTPRQIKDKFALPELPKYVSDVHVPKGSRIRAGIVAPQKGWGRGGAIQYELQGILPKSAFRNRRLLR